MISFFAAVIEVKESRDHLLARIPKADPYKYICAMAGEQDIRL